MDATGQERRLLLDLAGMAGRLSALVRSLVIRLPDSDPVARLAREEIPRIEDELSAIIGCPVEPLLLPKRRPGRTRKQEATT